MVEGWSIGQRLGVLSKVSVKFVLRASIRQLWNKVQSGKDQQLCERGAGEVWVRWERGVGEVWERCGRGVRGVSGKVWGVDRQQLSSGY